MKNKIISILIVFLLCIFLTSCDLSMESIQNLVNSYESTTSVDEFSSTDTEIHKGDFDVIIDEFIKSVETLKETEVQKKELTTEGSNSIEVVKEDEIQKEESTLEEITTNKELETNDAQTLEEVHQNDESSTEETVIEETTTDNKALEEVDEENLETNDVEENLESKDINQSEEFSTEENETDITQNLEESIEEETKETVIEETLVDTNKDLEETVEENLESKDVNQNEELSTEENETDITQNLEESIEEETKETVIDETSVDTNKDFEEVVEENLESKDVNQNEELSTEENETDITQNLEESIEEETNETEISQNIEESTEVAQGNLETEETGIEGTSVDTNKDFEEVVEENLETNDVEENLESKDINQSEEFSTEENEIDITQNLEESIEEETKETVITKDEPTLSSENKETEESEQKVDSLSDESISSEEATDINSEIEEVDEEVNNESENTKLGEDENYTANQISFNWEDYVGDYDTLVYGLISHQISQNYSIFPCYVTLSTSDTIYGYGYTNYDEIYTNDDGINYVLSGFISLNGELDIPESEFDSGLFLYNLDYQEDETVFLFAYQSSDWASHCVVYGNYLTYGVNQNSQIYYDYKEFNRKIVDLSLGSLYSYDEGRFLYDDECGIYTPISGESLANEIDYNSLQEELNEIIRAQDRKLYSIDYQTIVYTAKEAIISYLLSLQEETFLGYSVEELVSVTKSLGNLDVLRITNESLEVVNIAEIIEEPSKLCKWLVGIGCCLVAAIGTFGAIVTVECPVLSALCGACVAASVQVFMEVVVDNKTLENVNWLKVGISAVVGAVSGFVGPYLQTLGGVGYFVTDSLVDGVVGGIEYAAFSYIDGGNATDILKSFGTGVLIGATISGLFKGVTEVISTTVKGIGKLASKIAPKLTSKISKIASKLGSGISKLQSKVNGTVFHSSYIGRKIASKQALILTGEELFDLESNSIKYLSSDGLMDLDGNTISKAELKAIFDSSKNNTKLGYYKIGDEVIDVVKINNCVSIKFDASKYYSVLLKDGITGNRTDNLIKAADLFRLKWIKDSSTMPSDIMEDLLQDFPDTTIDDILENITGKDLYMYIRTSEEVLHENIDLETVTLVSRELHDKVNGYHGISHLGGVSLSKYVKQTISTNYFEELLLKIKEVAIVASANNQKCEG